MIKIQSKDLWWIILLTKVKSQEGPTHPSNPNHHGNTKCNNSANAVKTCRTKSVRMVLDKEWYFPATNNPLVVTTTVYKNFKHLVSAGNKGTFDVLRWNRRKWTAGSQLKPGVLGSVPSDCQIFTFLYVPLITWNMSLVYNNSQWLTLALEVPCTAQGLHQVRCTQCR